MTWRDKMEIGLKEDAPFRRDNLPAFEIEGPQVPAGPGRSSVVPAAVADAVEAAKADRPRRRPTRATGAARSSTKAPTRTQRRRS
jgi:hypothetical protein